jgi:hypothetical protein
MRRGWGAMCRGRWRSVSQFGAIQSWVEPQHSKLWAESRLARGEVC